MTDSRTRRALRALVVAAAAYYSISVICQSSSLAWLDIHAHDPIGESSAIDTVVLDILVNESHTPPLGTHEYLPNGLVRVNPAGAHPIYELIANAEASWEAKFAHSSTTLEQAVREYRRRYGRAPPKGFDAWWEYAQANNVRLPDEYDQIFHDLEPFYGLHHADLAAYQRENEAKRDTFTFGREIGGPLVVFPGENEHRPEADLLLNLLRDVAHLLPADFRAVVSMLDNPNQVRDYEAVQAAREAASRGTTIRITDLPRTEGRGWAGACPPSSPGAQPAQDAFTAPDPARHEKTFIRDHSLSMDPCQSPHLLLSHGQFVSFGAGPAPQVPTAPEFSYCSTPLHGDVRTASAYGWVPAPLAGDPDWEDKRNERLLWRGSNTGIWQAPERPWRRSQRIRLVRIANELGGELEILDATKAASEPVGEPLQVRKSLLNPAVMDVAFAGAPHSCDVEAGTCEVLKEEFEWRAYQTAEQAANYKYVLDIDGNAWSGRFKRLMASNSLILRPPYADRIQPWVHYIPVQIDLTDLHDAIVFFRGDGAGRGAHEDLAKKIALAGAQWGAEFWRQEDLRAYFVRLILEYARVMSEDREAMSYHEPGSAES
ncbi:glycosyltransferase family 90 protein [Schizophyllum amplum]|uniref:Glycosyltransferase family 90 protein n=1 Tax=Schizophyllum amplum TaxID=97359 RepID=A0A550CLI5_9AGAR|nr:glycosyltransferase family 90 protein [Auriculariopsis ampla]